MNRDSTSVRIGVLGAARIVETALVEPGHEVDGVVIGCIAARDSHRARAYAERHGIPTVHATYEDLLADPDVDAVYVPLPAALHARWTLAALDAGKHVLVEKPFTSNARTAEQVARAAAGAGTLVMEAYHSHYHPLIGRVRDLLASDEIGRPVSAYASFCVPIPPGRNIRWDLALGGGGLLDIGYYPVRALTELFGEPEDVLQARAWLRGGVDRRLEATLVYAGGVTGSIVSSMWSRRLVEKRLVIEGDAGRIRVSSPYHPHRGARIRVDGRRGSRVEGTDRRSTYSYQLEAFRDAVLSRHPVATDAAAAVRHAHTLDQLYAAAGLAPRP
ncbi:Gfo/Idh/MocA family protein [Agromyces intestinalis]|uniref:Gfo/Idh/MocA family protein n=1 Tax=Agromyces intestinalis TaxID=2592652 RepID=UPI00143D9A6E|nr:Gfo/Idh/MocA family oxidoreductase [Agromyces intestinalis]